MTTSVPSPRPVYIYALCEPETGDVRYVGQALDVRHRLRQHLQACHLKRPSYKNRWLRSLLAHELRPTLRILEETTTDAWAEAEKRWIAHYRAAGARLTNLTDGGDGTLGYEFPADVRARISASNMGHTMSAEHRAAVSAASKRRVWSDESRAKLSGSLKGRVITQEVRAKLSAQRRGQPLSPEHAAKVRAQLDAMKSDPELCARRAALWKQAVTSPEHAAKTSAYMKGRPKTPEHRAKIAAAMAGRPFSSQALAAAANKKKEAARARREAKTEGLVQLCLFTKLPQDD